MLRPTPQYTAAHLDRPVQLRMQRPALDCFDVYTVDLVRDPIAEMRRQASITPMTPAQETAWENQMRALFPDVSAGDRITGVHQPAMGAVFWGNGRLLGEVRDPLFAKLFFGIWLSPQTSEPQLRRALLAQEKSQAPAGGAP